MAELNNFLYKERAGLNVLANSIQNAKKVYEAAEGWVVIGVLSKDYPDVQAAAAGMKEYGEAIGDAVSIGLGGGDSRQSAVVGEIVKSYQGAHINQVFPAVGLTRANAESKECWINALVSPTGRPGFVNISTGVNSGNIEEKGIVPVKAAIALIKDMGGNAIKFFPMKGTECLDEYREVAKACGEEKFGLEPTGGLDLENFEEILRIALEANVPRVIPHVYSSIIDKATGETRVSDVRKLVDVMKRLVDAYE